MQDRADEAGRDLRPAGPPWRAALVCATLAVAVAACSGDGEEPVLEQEEAPMSIQVTSSVFAEGAEVPVRYTCDGEDVSPPLAWTGIPDGTAAMALVSDDPDATGGTWVHWVMWGISVDATGLTEQLPTADVLPDGARQGRNDFGKVGYGGPCPPPGSPHRYYFTLYALDAEPELEAGAKKSDLLSAIDGHVLAKGRLMGTYRRR